MSHNTRRVSTAYPKVSNRARMRAADQVIAAAPQAWRLAKLLLRQAGGEVVLDAVKAHEAMALDGMEVDTYPHEREEGKMVVRLVAE